MADLFAAADAIKRAAKQYELFMTAAEALERLGSIEQAEKESLARSAKAAKAAEVEEARLGKLRADAASVEASIEAKTQEAEGYAQHFIDNAQTIASSTVAAAKEKAAEIVQAATDEAARVKAEMGEKTSVALKKRTAIEADIAAAQTKLDRTNEEQFAIAAKIDSAKAQIAKLLG